MYKYKNGNHHTLICDNGTRIRITDNSNDTELTYDFPESIDMKITNNCNLNCSMCHENSVINGKEGNINLPFIDTLPPYIEIAIGGGNPLSHTQLIPLLEKLKDKHIVANMTVNEVHFQDNINLIDDLMKKKLIHGLGISMLSYDYKTLDKIIKRPNCVVHVIAGVMSTKDIKKIVLNYPKIKLLILGYKTFGRGIDYKHSHDSKIEHNIKTLEGFIEYIISHQDTVDATICFDNLAIDQLHIKEKFNEKEFNEIYQGKDGQSSMYINLVDEIFKINSISPIGYMLLPDITEMFKIIQNESTHIK